MVDAENQRNIIDNIRTLAAHPDVVAIKLCLSPVCAREKCSASRRYFSMAEALHKPPVPCHEPEHCYGSIEAVFDDEMTPAIYVEARIPFPSK